MSPLWITLQAVVWGFGLRAALDLRREFGAGSSTWTAFVWAVVNCFVMDLSMLALTFTGAPAFGVLSVETGIIAGLLMGLTVRGLLRDLATRATSRNAWAWDRLGVATLVALGTLAAGVAIRPGLAENAITLLHPLEGAIWLVTSLVASLVLATRSFTPDQVAVYRPRTLALAFGASFVHASLTPLAWLTGWTWPEGLGPLAGTLFIFTVVTSLYGTLLRVRGARLADAERQVHEAQTQLFSVEKLVAVGTLAAGAAHDFNNALTVISGSAQLALDNPEVRGQARQDIEAILHASQDAAGISRNLLQLARRQVPKDRVGSVRDAVLFPLESLAKDLDRRHIAVTTSCADPGPMDVDPSAIAQVCLNLYLNARDAMEVTGGGHLSVTLVADDHEVAIHVRDTGTGIPAWFQAKIFQPLQTTKGDKGTGLGLAGAKSIVEAMGGALNFETQEGHGTTFTIRLPRVPALASRRAS